MGTFNSRARLGELRRFLPGLALLFATSLILLMLDRNSRQGERAEEASQKIPRIAFVQHASIKALEDGRLGAIEQLTKRGFVDGQSVSVSYFNAEGDIATANSIAKEVTSGSYDLILTMSTPSLQTVANANKTGARVTHVFGLVTDPYTAGVGIDSADHLKHPPYMTGFGSMQPIEALFRIIREMRPETKRIGLVWNPAESNSTAQTLLARTICRQMSMELVEGSAENSAAVLEATNAVISQGVDCLWISGDITVSSADSLVIKSGTNAGIPVFCSLPSAVLKGSTLDLGADYVSIGRALGNLAADVLQGKSPSEIPVENHTDVVLLYNETSLSRLKKHWNIPASIRDRADGWINAKETKIPPHLLPSK
ncbi:MAG: ABC transporter substrate-binding protein [Planctomycetota bacterium]